MIDAQRRPTWNDSPEPRPARVNFTADTFFSPWPWCPYRDVPHDTHLTNEGNTWCAGLPGTLPGISVADAQLLLDEANRWYRDAYERLISAQRSVHRASRDLTEATHLLQAAQERDRATAVV